jgi:hypothetical protein
MIKIIRPGKTDFRKTCDKCGCIFEYNVEDIDDNYIKCPTCSKLHYGFEPDYEMEKDLAKCEPIGTELTDPKRFSEDYTTPITTTPDTPTYDLKMPSISDCKDCPTYKQMCSPTGYIGDVPCQWCSKNPWKLTCDTVSYTTGSTYDTSLATEDIKITCKAEGVEYDTIIQGLRQVDYISPSFTDRASCSEELKDYYNACTSSNTSDCKCNPKCKDCNCENSYE